MTRQFIQKHLGLVEENNKDLPSIDILLVAAHNDDEMFPTGYLIQAIGNNSKVGIIVATDGAGNVFYTNWGSHTLYRWDAGTGATTVAASSIINTLGLGIGGHSNV